MDLIAWAIVMGTGVWAGGAGNAGQFLDLGVGETVQITDLPCIQKSPSLSGDIVVWVDERSGAPEIYGYNLRTRQEFPVDTGGQAKGYPQIGGSVVAWPEKSAGYGVGYAAKDLATGQRYTLESGMGGYIGSSYLSVVGRKVFYTIYDSMRDEQGIYCRDLDTGVRTKVSDPGDYRFEPDADENWVVWAGTDGKLHLKNRATGVIQTIANPAGGGITEPVLGDGCVYFTAGYGTTSSKRIERYDIATGQFTVVSGESFRRVTHPSADGSIAIWTDYASMPAKSIEAFDASSGQRFNVVDLPEGGVLFSQQSFEIDGLRVAWTRTNAEYNRMDVFVTELIPEPATLGLLAVSALALIRRRKR